MPIPRKLLRAAWATLSEESLRAAARHCLDDDEDDGLWTIDDLDAELAERRGEPVEDDKWDKIPKPKLIAALADEEDNHLTTFLNVMSDPDQKKVAKVFGIDPDKPRKDSLAYTIRSFCYNYDRIMERREAIKKADTLPQFPADDLIAEGAKLQLPVLHLRPKVKGKPVAIWNAERHGKAKGESLWVSVDLRRHPDKTLRRAAVLDVFVDESKDTGKAKLHKGSLQRPKDGKGLLYATEGWEKPPLELLIMKGSSKLQTWLDDMEQRGWNLRESPDDTSFPLQDNLRAYEKAYQAKHPLYGKGVYAQLGGWPVGWPDATAKEQIRHKLVLRTYRASEPWVEVFQKGSGYQVCQRIT